MKQLLRKVNSFTLVIALVTILIGTGLFVLENNTQKVSAEEEEYYCSQWDLPVGCEAWGCNGSGSDSVCAVSPSTCPKPKCKKKPGIE
jgi:hypothetical protein